MSVVNVAGEDLPTWVKDPNNVYIGERFAYFTSRGRFPATNTFGCPFRIPDETARADIMTQYETYLRRELAASPTLLAALLSLRGKKLGCWCSPLPCHGDILLKIINEH